MGCVSLTAMLIYGIPLRKTKLVEMSRITRVVGKTLADTCLYVADKRHLECASVGVICFSVDPKTQNIFLLLGKEACFTNSRSSRGVWCDFGGRPEENETFVQTAAREFAEESMACVQLNDDHVPARYMQDYILNALENKNYYMRLDVVAQTYWSQHNRTRRDVLRVYYLKKIPWQPHLLNTFESLRNTMLVVKNDTDTNRCPFSLRNHPALAVYPQKTYINNHYLEKFSVRWWSLDRLGDVIRNRGRFRKQRFRKSFLSALRIVVKHLQSRYN